MQGSGDSSEMSKLAQNLDRSEGFLIPLWSNQSTDIGLIHQPVPPYSTIYFKFPIISGVDLNPVSEKIIFVNKNLELEKMGVICRSYTPWNAQTFYIPKAKPEITKTEWVNQGNKGADYVAGTKNTRASQTVRMLLTVFDSGVPNFSKFV